MKKNIHPKYNTEAKVKCTCGNEFVVGSTKDAINVEICSHCHPFYTGTQKLIDTARRVEKFEAKQEKSKQAAKERKGKKVKNAVRLAHRNAKEQKVKIPKDKIAAKAHKGDK